MKEIVLIAGMQASGKSTIVEEYVDQGYHRINRDITGGKLDGNAKMAKEAIAKGKSLIVLDNTYLTIESRESIIQAAKETNTPIRCIWMGTSFEDCQLNACFRMMEKHGHILSPEEIKSIKNPNIFPPLVLFSSRKKILGDDKTLKYPGSQIPTVKEGFTEIETRQFVRKYPKDYVNKALILDYDDTLRTSSGPNRWPEKPQHVQILPNRKEILKAWQSKGYLLLGSSNQSAVAKGLSLEDCISCFDKTNQLLGLSILYSFCPHKIPPVSCYCRKPSCGIGAQFIHEHKLNPSECIMVGDSTSDKTFATRCGFQYKTPEEFFEK